MFRVNQRIFSFHQRLIEATISMGDSSTSQIVRAAEMIASSLLRGHTIFTCGHDGPASRLGQLFSDNLAVGTQIERPGFPALSLNQLSQNRLRENRFAQALFTHGSQSDLLLIISRGGSKPVLLKTADAALERDMKIILISHKDDNILIERLGYEDLCIDMSEYEDSIVNVLHLQVLECLTELVDSIILGGK
tara:strand:- start:36362 stop:36937 length:576 start_codon:yes stop_codon:yes gene_type:complete